MKRNYFRRSFAAFLLLAVCTLSWANGTEIDGIYYVLNNTSNTAYVTYTGYSYFSYDNPTSTAYSGIVTIPSEVTYNSITYSVTSIGYGAFGDCSGLTSVTIPTSVTSIGGAAFTNCKNLTSVTIPTSVTNIGGSAFSGCSSLTSVSMSHSVTSIGNSVFSGCSSLKSIYIPNSVTSIGESAFSGCSSLEFLMFGKGVTNIEGRAFSGCSSLTSVTIPNNVTSIEDYTFSGCSVLTSVTIPDSLTSIGNGAFYNCTGLTSITIPKYVTSIGGSAFYGCSSLESVVIPSRVTSIGNLAFSYCPNIVDINVAAGNRVYDSRDNCNAIIETANNALVQGCKYTSIPNNVTEINSGAFRGMGSYMSFTIPVSVSVIHTNAFDNYERLNLSFVGSTPPEIEDYAFSKSGSVYATVPRGSSIAYSSCGFAEVIENKDDFPLITVNLAEAGMLEDKMLDMDDTDIRRLKISGPITASDINYLRTSARFTNLKYLDISEITLVPSNEQYAYFDITAKYGNGGTSGGTYARFYISEEEKNELVYQGSNGLGGSNQIYAYYSSTLAGAFEGMSLEQIILPPSFDRVGAFCFKGCVNLKEVSLANNNNFKSVEDFAFYGCKSLEELSLPSSVDSIGSNAFYGCGMLNNIGRLDNVKHLGDWAFADCTSLRNVGSLALVEKLGISCFYNCSSLIGDVETGILDLSSCNNIPDAQYYSGVFNGCSSLKKIKFSGHLKSIGTYAFNGCTNISSIAMSEGLETIGYGAFNSCSRLSTVSCPYSLLHVGYDAFKNTPFEQNFELDNGVRYLNQIAMSASSFSSISFREGTRSIADGFYETIDASGSYSHHPESCKSITLPSTLLCIGKESFRGVGITSLDLPESIEYIGPSAFADCTSLLGTLTVHENVSFVGGNAFGGCSGLVVINYNAPKAGSYLFHGCTGVEKVTIGPKVEVIPMSAFDGTNIKKLVFAERTDATPLYIGNQAFIDCKNIKEIVLPNGTDSIGIQAFCSCKNLTSVTIPNSVTSIGKDAFYGCTSLTSVTCQAKNVPTTGSSCFLGVPQSTATLYVPSVAVNAYKSTSPWSKFSTILPIGDDTNPNIQFADAAVKAICVANWDTDGDGELSEEEAAKVKNIGTVFQSNKEITSFNEFQYFTGLTSIGISTFYKCSGLTSVIIPMNVTNIGTQAFYSCSSLTSMTIPESVTSIGNYAFSDCSNLTSVTIPNNVKSIGNYAYSHCSGLSSVTIPNSVTSIGSGAFYDCSSLTKAEFESVESLCNIEFGNSAANPLFYAKHLFVNGQEIKDLTIPESVTSIGNYAFYECISLTSVSIPNSVTKIGNESFVSCSGLTSVTIPNSVIGIGNYAFSACAGLKSVTLGNSVASIGERAFQLCNALREVSCLAENVPSTGGSCFYSVPQSTATLYVPASSVNAYKSAEQWKNFSTILPIGDDTNPNIQFADAAVKAICVANWDTDGDGELSKDEAAQVTNIGTIFKSNETITSFDELQYFTGLTSLGYSAFEGCSNLTSVTFGNGLKSIGSWAFYLCSSLTSVTIPNNVTSINEGAFSYCTSLKSATIGDGVTGIGHSAFSYCTDLVSVTIGNSVRSIGNSAFVGCSSLPSIDIPNSVTSIAAGTFWGCTSLKSVTVPSSVESIGSDAFSGCYGLASVTLNSDNIVSAAYSSSNNLKTIFGSQVTRYILGNDVTSIGANAFRGCSDLISVTVPNSVTSIGEGAFAECDGLTSVTLNSNNIVSSTYTSSSNLNTVFGSQVIEYIIGDEVTSIGNYAFYSSTGLTSLTIGNGVTSIGDRAFYGCTGLKNVVCRAQRVPTASSNCFGGITLSSATLYVPASSVNSYKSTSPWSDFGTVTSIPDNFQIWGIKVNKSEILLHAQGNPYQLMATVVPEYAANKALTWTSSNTSVATVDANGLITPVNQGTAVITATTMDGTNLSATCTVTVDADNIIKDVSQLSNDKCYYIYTKDQLRGGLGVNKKYGSLATTFSVTNVKYKTENMSPFVFFKYHDRFLLYSVEANAFVTYNGGLTRMNIIGSNAINVTKNTNEYFMFSFASTGGVVNINTNPGLAINNWGTTSSQFDEGNQFIIEIAGDFDPSVMVALINESETVSDEDEEHYAQTPIQSVSELVNGQVYTAVTNRAAWYVPESGTQLESSKLPILDKWSCKNTGQQFAFILHDGKYYIYNVGEQKILNGITDNSPNHGELVTDNCQPVTISGTGNLQYPLFFSYGASYNVNINSWGEVVIDTWTTLDDGNMVALRPVQGVTLSESDLRRIIRYIDGSIPGDVNGDGDVNGADIVAVINYVLNDSKTEGDVNGDGEVNGADIVAVINYVLSYTSDAVRQQTYYAHRAPARPTDTSDRLYANTVTDGITVGLTNETDFTAFQFILQLPEDCTLENVIADGLRLDNHVLQFRRMADGRYFVLGYNLDNENIAGHDGALLRLQLAGNICEGASVTDVMFFTPEAETRHLAGIQIDLVTGLTSLENATEDVTGNIYDMQGRVVMTSGQYAKQKNFLPTGIYIRNGRKFVVK